MVLSNASLGLVLLGLYLSYPALLPTLSVTLVALSLAYRGYTKLRGRYAQLEILYAFTQLAGTNIIDAHLGEQILVRSRELLQAKTTELLIGTSGQHLGLQRIVVNDSGLTRSTVPLADLPPTWAEVFTTGTSLTVPRSRRRKSADADHDYMVSPLKTDSGTFGLLVADQRLGDIRGFDDEDRKLFDTLASHAAAWLHNSQMAIEREHEALHDSLTDLPNRRLLLERAEAAIETTLDEGSCGAMILIDLDHFKDINDTWGHTSGDDLLVMVSARLVSAVPADATVARLGGDEFAILLPYVAGPGDALDRAHDIRTVLEVPVQLNDVAVHVEASTGVALFPAHGEEASTILQRADVAMYVAKNDRSGVALYSHERDTHSAHRLSLLGELRDAIATGQMVLRFQPKVALRTGQVTGVEALVRWQHPVHGIISPDEFIPFAEQTGLMNPLFVETLRQALTQARAWMNEDLFLDVSVNLSVRNLTDPNLPAMVVRLLEEHRVPAGLLTLEVTETGIMTDPARTVGVLRQLASVGVRLSIDDFGTGQSSFGRLADLPIAEVKIDKCFIRDFTKASNRAVVQSIIDLGRNLGLGVVAEGIEDAASYDVLADMGCDTGQGYFIQRPLPGDWLTTWLQATKQAAVRHRED